MINQSDFIFKKEKRKSGTQVLNIISVYEKGFPYKLDDLFEKNLSIKDWILNQEQMSFEERLFDKLVVLFRNRKNIEYGIYLSKHQNGNDEDMINKFQEIYKIDCFIHYIFLKIQNNLPILLEQNKEVFTSNIEETLFDEILNYYQFYSNICIKPN